MTSIEKKKTSKKTAVKPDVEELKVEAPKVEAPKVEEPEVESETEVEVESLEKQFDDLKEMVTLTVKELNDKLKTFRSIEAAIKKLGSAIKKELKLSKKKKTRKNSNMSSEHGFNAPVKISDELADFLDMKKGSKLRRPAVTSLISQYADKHNLKDEKNRGIFRPDSKLKKLLGPAVHPLKKGSDVKGYGIFNLQIYLKRHFIKEAPVVA
jgi:chromatin remodeling complex protein RSC6